MLKLMICILVGAIIGFALFGITDSVVECIRGDGDADANGNDNKTPET